MGLSKVQKTLKGRRRNEVMSCGCKPGLQTEAKESVKKLNKNKEVISSRWKIRIGKGGFHLG